MFLTGRVTIDSTFGRSIYLNTGPFTVQSNTLKLS